ncbi:protein phosphatase 1 regulatory subunit 3C-B [Parasteatoda tepidariorum]|uniref:protein phosphatase 1 regulatory subunit 3C-B n=1 Tax=Parasteatoda tepidariorum TaxID=114398 RepID=UPI00077F91B3|nr:protein phosphatase 1 regulatory subunit 3C-B [Parasteatoda tepidariorum]
MPVDLEVFLSQTGAGLFDFSRFVESQFSLSNNDNDNGFLKSYSFPRSHILIPKDSKGVPTFENKETLDSYNFNNDSKGCKKVIVDGNKRKKVSFADDKGFRLVEIREIPGLSALPTTTTVPERNNTQNGPTFIKGWKIASENPPWTDSKLIELLETNKVVLESAIIKTKAENGLEKTLKDRWSDNFRTVLRASGSNNEYVLQGNIKVKNLVYEKNVFVRISFDRWLSSVDVKATYLKPEKNPEKHYEYNNFTFSIDIPPSALKFEVIEFCIGYICNKEKYWDNTGGVNYRLVTEIVKNKTVLPNRSYNKKSNDRITLSLTENIERFSEIDSWNNFINNQPYW